MKDSIDRIEEEGHSVILKEFFERNQKQILMNSIIMENKSGVAIEMTTAGFNVMREDGVVYGVNGILIECSGRGMFIVDKDSREVLQVNGEDVSGIEHARVLDLNDDGERWEGDVLNDEPYGWGMLYDSENRRVYEGFRIGGVNVCYGIEYYADIGVIEYEGEWCDGKRWGRGVQYDRNGEVMYDGEWKSDVYSRSRIITGENTVLQAGVEELVVSDNSYNSDQWKTLDLSILPKLRVLHVGNRCFNEVESLQFLKSEKLERIEIGDCSFGHANELQLNGLNELASVQIGRESFMGKNDSGGFCVKNCRKLRELIIGACSFSHCSVCEIDSLPSLTEIAVGCSPNEEWDGSVIEKGFSQTRKVMRRCVRVWGECLLLLFECCNGEWG